jgi:hypothetical protein
MQLMGRFWQPFTPGAGFALGCSIVEVQDVADVEARGPGGHLQVIEQPVK